MSKKKTILQTLTREFLQEFLLKFMYKLFLDSSMNFYWFTFGIVFRSFRSSQEFSTGYPLRVPSGYPQGVSYGSTLRGPRGNPFHKFHLRNPPGTHCGIVRFLLDFLQMISFLEIFQAFLVRILEEFLLQVLQQILHKHSL